MESLQYQAREVTANVAAERYISNFRDAATFAAACRECPCYNRRWGCPPYDHDPLLDLAPYRHVLIVGVKITPADRRLPMERVYDLMRPEVVRVNRRLLQLERESGGFAFSFTGKCAYCGDLKCTRPEGKPCRHPDLVRPSLEAYGFDIAKTTSELLGLDIAWSRDRYVPPHVTIVCALFHNSDGLAW